MFGRLYQQLSMNLKNIKQIELPYFAQVASGLFPLLEQVYITHEAPCDVNVKESSYNIVKESSYNIDVTFRKIHVISNSATEAIAILNQKYIQSAKHVEHVDLIIYDSISRSDLQLFCSDQLPTWWSECRTLSTRVWSILLHPDFCRVSNFNTLILNCQPPVDVSNSYLYTDINDALGYRTIIQKTPSHPMINLKVLWIDFSVLGHEATPTYEAALRILLKLAINLEKVEFQGFVGCTTEIINKIAALIIENSLFRAFGFTVYEWNDYSEACITICKLGQCNKHISKKPSMNNFSNGYHWQFVSKKEFKYEQV